MLNVGHTVSDTVWTSAARPSREDVRMRRCGRILPVVAAAGVLTAAIAGCGGDDGPATASVDPAFYETPDLPADGEPGDVLRAERLGSDSSGTRWRILYRSESLDGRPIAVSGLVDVPPGEPPAGGWPVVSFAHGTTGIADQCAPSRLAVAEAQGDDRFIVAVTDYEGLGTEGTHPYLVGESEGRSVIDIVRAARSMGDDVRASDRYALIGYSQGGHAALFANQIAESWAPELELVGTVAGAPAVELDAFVTELATSAELALPAMLLVGLQTQDPAVDPARALPAPAVDLLGVVAEQCTTEILEAFEAIDPGASAPALSADPAVAAGLAANTPGNVAGPAPVLVIHAGQDELLPVPLMDAAVDRMCAAGQVVTREAYPQATHASVLAESVVAATDWLAARFAGEPVESIC